MRKTAIIMAAVCPVSFGGALSAPWSPDGEWIVYSYIGGPESLYIARADGSDERALLVREQRDFRPEWAPDGSHVIFTSVIDGAHVMMRIDPDGSNLSALSVTEDAAGGADYSPDGATIAYFTDEPLSRELYLRDAASGATTALTDTPEFQEMSPRWAPDGRRLVFVGKENGENVESDIWTIDTETGERKNLTQSPETGEFHPDWSHDGEHVVYIRVKDGAFDVALRDVETLEEKIIASGNGYAVLSPHFSPDDQAVSFTRTDFAEKGENMPAIVRVSLSGGDETVIARNRYLSQME